VAVASPVKEMLAVVLVTLPSFTLVGATQGVDRVVAVLAGEAGLVTVPPPAAAQVPVTVTE
jgi:hypothetical protein